VCFAEGVDENPEGVVVMEDAGASSIANLAALHSGPRAHPPIHEVWLILHEPLYPSKRSSQWPIALSLYAYMHVIACVRYRYLLSCYSVTDKVINCVVDASCIGKHTQKAVVHRGLATGPPLPSTQKLAALPSSPQGGPGEDVSAWESLLLYPTIVCVHVLFLQR